jgi:hypothetical protein
MRKEAVAVKSAVISRNMCGRSEDNHEKSSSGYPVSLSRFKLGASIIYKHYQLSLRVQSQAVVRSDF